MKAEHPAVTKATLQIITIKKKQSRSGSPTHVACSQQIHAFSFVPGVLIRTNHKRPKSSFKGPLAPFGFGGNRQETNSTVMFPQFTASGNSACNKNKSIVNEKCLHC